MRRLILFRHGKSDWDAPFGSDHERPLSKRGVKAAKTMGLVLARSDLVPDHAITSSAVRARTTLESPGDLPVVGHPDRPIGSHDLQLRIGHQEGVSSRVAKEEDDAESKDGGQWEVSGV